VIRLSHAAHARPVLGALVAGCLWGLGAPALANPALQQGRALFLGSEAMPARSGTGGPALPASASRCSNCHSAPGVPGLGRAPVTPDAGSAAGNTSFGPALNSALMLNAQPRRGGPSSRYDAPALCRLLRQGIDPAGVVLAAAMPRYVLSDAQCLALWTLLTSDL